MRSPDKKTEQEMKMVKAALSSEKGERKLIEYLTPSVKSEAKTAFVNWTKKRNVSLTEQQEIDALNARWDFFYFSLEKYQEKIDRLETGEEIEIHPFSEYFAWFARQGVTKHLSENHGPNLDDLWFNDDRS